MALTPKPSHDVAGVIAEGVGVSLSGGLARRSRVNLKRYNSDPSPSVMDPPSKFVIGVCAMDKKARSKPMTAILQRIMSFNEFEVIVFGDQMILEKPVEDWPLCDCLLSWHSDGFPLAKAQAYVQLRHPFCVNDSLQQEALLDRRMVYQTLKANGIPVPHHIVVSRDHPSDNAENGTTAPLTDPPGFVEELDWVEKDGVRITKPFVEKPVSGENHNIYIYYHSSHGGGVKRLFRKVDDKSADYDSNHPGNVRRDGSYIYEEFLTTGGTDVKVYTVGPRYAHAEARKSPVVDGKVHRASDGKEMRYPVLLSPQEKEISRMVCLAFSQKVCGFDLLRSEKGKSYVCDVNGWSFVKNSTKYLDDAAGILRSMILTALAPQRVMTMPMLLPAPIPTLREEDEEGVVVPNGQRVGQYQSQSMKNVASLQDIAMGGLEDDFNEHEELRCVLAVVRHGDRTPKQKFKCKVSQPALLALFDKHRNSKGDQAKLKNPLQLQEFLGVVRKLVDTASAALADIAAGKTLDSTEHSELGKIKLEKEPIEDFFQQMSIVLTVMEQGGGHFSGVNRKVQLKPVRLRGQDLSLRPSASEPAMMVPPPSPGGPSLTPTPSSTGGGGLQLEEALLVVKWGGVLTHAGRGQAEQLGQQFRATMYPRHGPAGGGLLRLHSTYRHDLKIYSSDEGRVQVSAAAFTKGLLDLEGNSLTPILVSLVNKDASMLEAFGKGASEEMQACKDVIQAQLTHDPAKGPPPPIRAVLPVPSGVQSNASPSPPFSPRPPIIQPGQPRKPPPSTSLSGVPANAATTALGVVRAPSGHLAAPTAVAALAAWNATHAPSPSRGNSPGLPLVPDPRVTPRDMVIVEAPPGASPTSLSQADLGRSVPNLLPVITVGAPVVSSTPHSSNSSSGGDNGGAASRLGLTLPGSALGGTSLHRTASAAGDAAVPSTPMEQPQSPLVLHIDKLMHMPDQPLALLQSLRSMMRTLVDQLQDMFAKEAADRAAGSGQPPVKAYNSQSQAPDEWELTPTQPCSGEKLVLLHDRWRKLYDAVYSEKKQQFDISKIPDIYDSVKHDAIHNAHLGLPLLKDLYAASKALADVVIPQEYGLEPRSKLSIGSKIAKELVGKLLADMSSMKMESESTAVEMGDSSMVQGSGDELYGPGGDTMATEFGRNCLEDDRLRNRHGTLSAVFNRHSTHAQGAGDEGAGGGGDDLEDSARHRLCPTYASDINSPLRHVRTRIYYTSESHIHSLMNVLRFCYLREGVTTPLVGEEMQKLLDATPENDYLTHVVFRMFENLSMPVGDPARFRVEVLFSPGAACNPITQTPADHTLPVVQLEQLNAGVAQTFHEIENLLAPFAVARKVQASYALSIALKAPSNPLSRNDSSLQSSGVTASMIRSASGNNLKQRSSAGGAHRDSITGRLSNATGSSSSSCLNQLDRTSDSHGTSGGSVSACVHCPESADGSAGGAGGSAMAGLVSKLAKMTSLPIHAKDQQQLAELLQEPTTPRQQRQVAKLLGVDSITPELGDVLDRLEISSASSGPAIILHGLNLG